MDYQQLIDSMSPQLYQRLQQAVETGRWPDGSSVTAQQRESALQAVIVWGQRNLAAGDRVGFIKRKQKAQDSARSVADVSSETPLNWKT